MIKEHIQADVVVAGGGIAGLVTAHTLLQRGYDVLLVEKEKVLSRRATSRNQGWLHARTLQADQGHFASDKRGKRIADVQAGFNWYKPYLTGVSESPTARTFFVFSDQARAAQAEEAWREAEIPATRVHPLSDFFEADGRGVNPQVIQAAFQVADVSINTSLLSRTLAEEILEMGGRIITGTSLHAIDQNTAGIKRGEVEGQVHAGMFVVTAGAGIKSFFEEYTHEPFPMRYIQDYSLITPQLSPHGIIWRQERGVNVMPHGDTSVTCLGLNLQETEEPIYDYSLHNKQAALDAVAELMPEAANYREMSRIAACLKPYVPTDPEVTSGDIKIEEWAPGYVYCLPGKMTAAPVAAEMIVDFVANRKIAKNGKLIRQQANSTIHVAQRPSDVFPAQI